MDSLFRFNRFNEAVKEVMRDVSRLDEKLFLQIKAMPEADVDEFLGTFKEKDQSMARVNIEFIRKCDNFEICRLTLLGAGFSSIG